MKDYKHFLYGRQQGRLIEEETKVYETDATVFVFTFGCVLPSFKWTCYWALK